MSWVLVPKISETEKKVWDFVKNFYNPISNEAWPLGSSALLLATFLFHEIHGKITYSEKDSALQVQGSIILVPKLMPEVHLVVI